MSMAMGHTARTTTHSVTSLVLVAPVVRTLRLSGLIPIHWLQVYVRWDQLRDEKHSTITGMGGISGRLLVFISHFFGFNIPIWLNGYLIGQLFVKRFKDAVAMRTKHQEAFQMFSSTFSPSTVAKRLKMVQEWEIDRTKPNPYEEPVNRKFDSFNI